MKVVIAEDTEDSRLLLEMILQDQGYEVYSGENGLEALKLVSEHKPDLIISDILMPKMDGFEFCRKVRSDPELSLIPFIFYSSNYTEQNDREFAEALGAVKFVIKPLAPEKLVEVIDDVMTAEMPISPLPLDNAEDKKRELDELHLRSVGRKLDAKVEELELRNVELARSEEKYRATAEMLQTALMQTINAIANTVEMRDPYTAGHQRRVADLAQAIAEELELDNMVVEGVRMGAIIHDIGKIRVPAEIMNYPGKLGADQMAMIRAHAAAGFEIIKEVPFPWPIAEMINQHHERLDGSGYPQGLSSDDIILEAKILAVADVVEAINSHRPFRASLGIDVALGELEENRGLLYDPDVVDACLRLFK
ncbi:MAG: response regulator, partial [Gammaproteobacteria bacterium]|nr:response regulator [Gammaproteobacteria bacterium]